MNVVRPKSARRAVIPPDLIRPGLMWGRADGKLYAYAVAKADLRDVPDRIDGVPVVKRVVGAIRPAAG
jgi:hypothetical protein